MFRKVARFGVDYAGDFPENSESALLLAELDGVISRIGAASAQQANSGARLTKEQALELLEDLMEGIADTARTVARRRQTPELRTQLRLTPGAGESQWLTDAQRFLDRFDPALHSDAAEVKAAFIALELPADFVTQLSDYKQAVTDAQNTQIGSTRNQAGATTSLSEDFATGMEISKTLDTICENRYGRNPQTKDARKLREWRQARHIEKAGEAPSSGQTTGQNTNATP